jgi:5-methylcytosine-specific restriction endonuclease McrBC regulatory subunit McrC
MAGFPVRRRPQKPSKSGAPLDPVKPVRDVCLEIMDHSRFTTSAVEFFGTRHSADPKAQAARLAEQLIQQNAAHFAQLQVTVSRDFDGRDVFLNLESQGAVGAIPLLSPFTARHDYGLIVQPRFPWAGIGPMLAEMGWRVSPSPLRLPLLKRSERKVPPWVLGFTVLTRLKALLDQMDRRFEVISEIRSAPKGRVEWTQYANRHVARADLLSIPCTFPELRDDRQLKGAIRFTLEKQIRSLETQVHHGAFVHRLIAFAESLLHRLGAVVRRRPEPGEIQFWLRRPLRTTSYFDGLQAIDWTVEERGLAGLSDLNGIPWKMPMDQFFEAWVETVLQRVTQRSGGVLRTGRRKETVAPIAWDPPYVGSQRSLIPDLVLETEDRAFIFDAKYKRHWEELQSAEWRHQSPELREDHRADLMQVLAYANLVNARDIVCCLVYPCSTQTWESLSRRNRLFHTAELPNRGRTIRVWLTAVPMSASIDQVSSEFVTRIRAA